MRAYAGEEPARTAMSDLLHDDSRTAIMSTVNLSEATGALLQQYSPEAADDQERVLRELVKIEPPSADVAVCAGRVAGGWYLSQADAMAVATALQHDAPLWTGDPELLTGDRCWLAVDLRNPERKARQEQRRSAAAPAPSSAASDAPTTSSRDSPTTSSPPSSWSRCTTPSNTARPHPTSGSCDTGRRRCGLEPAAVEAYDDRSGSSDSTTSTPGSSSLHDSSQRARSGPTTTHHTVPLSVLRCSAPTR